MNRTRLSSLLAAVLLAACDASSKPPTPAQFEQAKADCQPHGGLVEAELVISLKADRVDAVCRSGVRVSRDAA